MAKKKSMPPMKKSMGKSKLMPASRGAPPRRTGGKMKRGDQGG